MNRKTFSVVAILVFVMVVFFSYDFYENDIKRYRDALNGEYYFFQPTEKEEALWNYEYEKRLFRAAQWKYELEKFKARKLVYPSESDMLQDFREWTALTTHPGKDDKTLEYYEWMADKTSSEATAYYIEQQPKGHNPPKEKLDKLLREAGNKRASLMAYSIGAYFLIISSLYIYRVKRQKDVQ